MTARSRCRGWTLVATRDHVTGPERDAANAHLALCRTCRDRLQDREAAHGLVRSVTAAAGGVAAADAAVAGVMTAGGASGAAGLAAAVGGAPWAATIIGATIAVVATAGGVAVAHQPGAQPTARHPSTIVRHDGAKHAQQGSDGGRTPTAESPHKPATGASPPPSLVTKVPPLPVSVPSLPTAVPLPVPTSVSGVRLPDLGGALPTEIPAVPLPTAVPVPKLPLP